MSQGKEVLLTLQADHLQHIRRSTTARDGLQTRSGRIEIYVLGIACRILTGNGYDCYNLAGGFKLYQAIKANEGTT